MTSPDLRYSQVETPVDSGECSLDSWQCCRQDKHLRGNRYIVKEVEPRYYVLQIANWNKEALLNELLLKILILHFSRSERKQELPQMSAPG